MSKTRAIMLVLFCILLLTASISPTIKIVEAYNSGKTIAFKDAVYALVFLIIIAVLLFIIYNDLIRRKGKRPALTILNNRIIVDRMFNKQEILFSDIDLFGYKQYRRLTYAIAVEKGYVDIV